MNRVENSPARSGTPEETITSLLRRYLILDSTRWVAFNISAMFVILYLLDTLESAQAGLLFAFSYIVLTLIDYPTGVLGDVIGFQKVMILAYSLHTLSFILLIVSDSFIPLLIYSGVAALASSQESGALESWFDNKYRILAEKADPDRQGYKSFQAKRSILLYTLMGGSFIVGGVISFYFGRKILFSLSLVFIVIMFLLIFGLMKDGSHTTLDFNMNKYLNQFFGGIKFLFSEKGIALFFVGSTIIWAANNSIWVNFVLFRLYEGYSGGSDNTTALFRAIIFASGVFWQLIIVRYISKFRNTRFWILITTSFSNPIFFGLIYWYYLTFPPTSYDLMLLLGLFIVFQLPSIWEPLEGTLRSRVSLDLVPDDRRNAVYSLLPSITNLLGIGGALFGGLVIENYGFADAILLTTLVSFVGVIIVGIGLKFLPD
jgi:MFS family permease